MNSGYIEGLQAGINMFEQAVKDHAQELDSQQRAGAAASVRSHLRGAMRAYAEMVGALRTEIMAAKGEPTDARSEQFDAYLAAAAKADVIQDAMESTASPTLKVRLASEWEAAERQADAMIVTYAML
jgi:hypothetical protein